MKKLLCIQCLLGIFLSMYAQFPYGTTGLLHMPTADMQKDKTFMFGGSFLDITATPGHWNYGTFNYYIDLTIFPWLEVGYTCTLHKATNDWVDWKKGKFVNQDRSFHGRLRICKEEFGKYWMPQIVLGVNDPSTNDVFTEGKDDYGIGGVGTSGNGHWNRYYLAFTKHFFIKNISELGVHLAYVYNKRTDYHLNGLAFGANFRFQLSGEQPLFKVINRLNFMAEYDSHTINIGAEYSFWKDYINAVVEFNQCRYFSGGLIFKIHLK